MTTTAGTQVSLNAATDRPGVPGIQPGPHADIHLMSAPTDLPRDAARSHDPISRLVAVLDEPIAVRDFDRLTREWETEFGPGLRVGQGRWTRFDIRTPGRICWCLTCDDIEMATYTRLTGEHALAIFVVCPDCGNKRCPRATHHDQACGNSNEAGQPGSAYI